MCGSDRNEALEAQISLGKHQYCSVGEAMIFILIAFGGHFLFSDLAQSHGRHELRPTAHGCQEQNDAHRDMKLSL